MRKMVLGMRLCLLVHQESLIPESRAEWDGWDVVGALKRWVGCSWSPEKLHQGQQFPIPHPRAGWGGLA